MSTIILGVGDFGASRQSGDTLKTYSLGSCVAVVILDPIARAVAMAHVVLPDSGLDPVRAKARPGYFADSALAILLARLIRLGSAPGSRRLIVKLAGGANVADPNNMFNIGKRNVLSLETNLAQRGLAPQAEDVGGNISRTVSVDVDSGRVVVSSGGRGAWEL